MLLVVLIGFAAQAQSIYNWNSSGSGMDDRFALISGYPSITKTSYFNGTSQMIHGDCQLVFRTNFPLSQQGTGSGGWYHTISFRYVASQPVRFVVFLSAGCGWQYFTLPPVTTPTNFAITYFAPKQLYLLWYTPGCTKSWFEIDDVMFDIPLDGYETITVPDADTTDLTNPNLIKIKPQTKPGLNDAYDILGRRIK